MEERKEEEDGRVGAVYYTICIGKQAENKNDTHLFFGRGLCLLVFFCVRNKQLLLLKSDTRK